MDRGKPGCAANWYFRLLPNLHGRRQCGAEYNGIVIRRDGRVVQHCTSVSLLDVADTQPVCVGCITENHLFGIFTTAKEKVVAAGRARAAGNECGAAEAVGMDESVNNVVNVQATVGLRAKRLFRETNHGHLQSDLEATTDEDCPKVQARRREAVCRCVLGLDLYRPKGDKGSSDDIKDDNDD